MSETPAHPLESLFYSKNIAVVGASPKGGLPGGRWGGNTYLEGSINLHFKGKIFPMAPERASISAKLSVMATPETCKTMSFSSIWPRTTRRNISAPRWRV